MPLDSRKIAHIKSRLPKIFQGRSQTIRLTLRTTGGGTATLDVPAVWRDDAEVDPTRSAARDQLTHIGNAPNVLAVFSMADVSLAQLRAVITAAPVSPATNELGARYTLVAITPRGMPAGGDRWLTEWTKQA